MKEEDRRDRPERPSKVKRSECIWYRVCPMKRAYDKGLLEERFIRDYCLGSYESCIRYQMESRGEPHPDWMRQDGVLDERLEGI